MVFNFEVFNSGRAEDIIPHPEQNNAESDSVQREDNYGKFKISSALAQERGGEGDKAHEEKE